MLGAEEDEELQVLAVADFRQGLRQGGPSEATSVLLSYLAELAGAPEELLLQLAGAFQRHAAEAAAATALAGGGSSDACFGRQQIDDLQKVLLRVVSSSARATKQVQDAVQNAETAAIGALLYGQAGEAAEAAVQRLESRRSGLAAQLGGAVLENLPTPTTHQQQRSLLACLLHLHLFPAPGLAPGVPQRLTASLAVPPWFGQDLPHARQQLAAAFEAFAAVVQHPSVCKQLLHCANQHPAALKAATGGGIAGSCGTPEAALHFLLLFRSPLPGMADLWWAHFAALLHSVVDAVQQGGLLLLRHGSLQTLLRCLCCAETAHMVVRLVLAHPSFQPQAAAGATNTPAGGSTGGRKRDGSRRTGGGGRDSAGAACANGGGPKAALALAAGLLAHDVPAFLSGCCELLRPEASYPLQTRVDVLAAMDRAAGKCLDDLEGQRQEADEEEGDGGKRAARLRLWPPAALDQLLWVLRSDPSIRVRREAVRLLSTVAVGVGTPQEATLLRAVLLRARDRDDAARHEAFALLAQFPQASLEAHLQLTDWQALLDVGLTASVAAAATQGKAGSNGGRNGTGKATAKHAAAIQAYAHQLLLRYLCLPGADQHNAVGATGEDYGDGEEAGGGLWGGEEPPPEHAEHAELCAGSQLEQQLDLRDQHAPGSPCTWLARLRDLQQLPPHHPACSAAQQLRAVWRTALEQVLSAEQLGQLAEEDAGTDGGGSAGNHVSGGAGDGGGSDQEMMDDWN